jgi:hypothetical protein
MKKAFMIGKSNYKLIGYEVNKNMNTQKPSKMPYIIIGIVVAVAVLVYFYWAGSSTPSSETLEETSNGQVVGAKVFVLLNEINYLKIDSTFFTDPSYKTLRDYSVPIPTLPIGRPNPFAPLPGVLAPGVTVTAPATTGAH